MDKNFFSEVQGKFKAEFHGRYLGNIIEQIAATRAEVVGPLLEAARLKGSWALKSVREVATEVSYPPSTLETECTASGEERRADLAIELDNGKGVGRVLVEIKVKDSFLPGQLEGYIAWAQARSAAEDRAVVLLTAFPLGPDELRQIKAHSGFVSHLYLSQYLEKLRPIVRKSELIALFADYLFQEGYAMFQLIPNAAVGQEVDDADFDALLSFLVLTFLPHVSGKGKVVSAKKIARGPVVFGSLIQNWQLVSNRLADTRFGADRRPTIRYWPEQATTSPSNDIQILEDQSILSERWRIRGGKLWGRYWLTADTVLEDNVRIDWGQIIEVQRGKADNDINCSLYVLIRKGKIQYAGKLVHLKDGIRNRDLYGAEAFLDRLGTIFSDVRRSAINEHPELDRQLGAK